MIELQGKYNIIKVFTDYIDSSTQGQIIALCNNENFKDCKIRIMPDCHAGKGCVIGTTIKLNNKVDPLLLGNDIGCGVLAIQLKEHKLEMPKLDSVVRNLKSAKSSEISDMKLEISKISVNKKINSNRALIQLGTLGGGNHFIEVDKSSDGTLYLIIHSGSRSLGSDVLDAYLNLMRANNTDICENGLFSNYLDDISLVQNYAHLNRLSIAYRIIKEMKLHALGEIESVHNYIDPFSMILHKGSISAINGKNLIIPLNMRDGSLICVGKGNEDWNMSAPHGAGRLYSRSESKDRFTLSAFKKSMVGVYTSSVGKETIDECPMVYKDMNEIIKNIVPTVEVVDRLIPIYNFKQFSKE